MELKKAFIKLICDPFFLWKWGDYAMFRYARELDQSQFLSVEEVRALQFQRLRLLLDHAYRRCPFYREQFQTLGLSPSDIQSLTDLRSLPILEKRDIQEHFEMMVAEGWPQEDLILDHTGGSTGSPIAFYQNRERKRSRGAAACGDTTLGPVGRSETELLTLGSHHATCPRTRGGPG